MFYVYCIQNTLNNKIYIGKTNNVSNRFSDHITIANRGITKNKKVFSLLHKAIRKYKKGNFTIQTIDEFEDEQECLEAEKF